MKKSWASAAGRLAVVLAMALAGLAPPSSAQQGADGPAAQQTPGSAPADPKTPGSAGPQAQPPVTPEPGTADAAGRPLSDAIRVPRELSPLSMFLSADILVKAVMISLTFASLMTWTIFLAKSAQLFGARRRLGKALARIAEAPSLREAQLALGAKRNALSALLSAATQEIRMSADSPEQDGIKERAASRFSDIVRTEARAARYGMGVIATVGATSPFVGLFGTVWGIMNSFIGISKAQTTNLAVVAPGIAEALLATAFGLAAAIPAVIMYNHLSRSTKGYLDLLSRGSGAIGRLLSRDLDRFHRGMNSRAAE